jgi:hypothetical protein
VNGLNIKERRRAVNANRVMIFLLAILMVGMVFSLAAAPSQASIFHKKQVESQYGEDQGRYGQQPEWNNTSADWRDKDIAAKMSTPLPTDAKPGECFARVYIPPEFKTVTERMLVREASERVEIIPAQYTVVDEKVMVKGPSKCLVEVPAQYKWVDEKVLVEEAHAEWRPGRGAFERVDSATGEIMCLVEVPASYKVVRKQVLVSPATVREEEIPAEYTTIKVTKMTSPPQERRTPIPEEYQTVTRTEKVSDGRMEWKKVECEPNQKPMK